MKCPKCKQDVTSGWHQCQSTEKSDSPQPDLSPYGAGVRAQVFEVIVRQGMVGAPWREICVGPMQTNNITPEEIQAEIDKRKGSGSGPFDPPVPKKPLPTKGSGGAALSLPKTAMGQLHTVLEVVSTMIKEKKSANDAVHGELEKIRTELNVLSDLMIDEEMTKNKADSEARLQQDLDRENSKVMREIKPPGTSPPNHI